MNIERLTIIAEWLEAGAPHKDGIGGFYMPKVLSEGDCGTRACIAGCAVQWWGSDDLKAVAANEAESQGDYLRGYARLLGLPETVADKLFFPDSFEDEDGDPVLPYDRRLDEVTPAWAARCIRKLMATGDVDWVGTENV